MGNETGSTTILRGFKVSVPVLDAFLATNGEDKTYGTPPFLSQHGQASTSKLLHAKVAKSGGTADKSGFRLVIPVTEGRSDATVAYMAYAWVAIYAHRELRMDEDLPAEAPAGFEELREEVLSFADRVPDEERVDVQNEGHLGLFAVYTHGIRGVYTPQELYDRHTLPQRCDQCDATFDEQYEAFKQRQQHRIEVHGVKESLDPLPDA